jgi:hypothetical protein
MVDWKPESRHVELDVSVSGCSPAYVAISRLSVAFQISSRSDFELHWLRDALYRVYGVFTCNLDIEVLILELDALSLHMRWRASPWTHFS